MNVLNAAEKLRSEGLNPRSLTLLLLCGLVLVTAGLLGQVSAELAWLIVTTLSDAYLAVSVFVALSLLLIYFAQHYLGADLIGYLNDNPRLQVPIAALLGVLPGCGGAIIVVTQFVHGRVGFAALVAVLISTMGDASFLLLAREPQTALLVLLVSLTAAVVSGYLIQLLHPVDFLRPPQPQDEHQVNVSCSLTEGVVPVKLSLLWRILLLPGLILGVLAAFQIEPDSLFGSFSEYHPATWLGFAGAVVSLLVWLSQPANYSWAVAHADMQHNPHRLVDMVASETSFVSAWVIAGFLSFELLVYFTGLDLQSLFSGLGYLTILLAVLVGFVPGCGPQIIMTTLYLQGVVPLSAQLANAISNDGDALFPALALAPQASLYATLYSAAPALLIGYVALGLGY